MESFWWYLSLIAGTVCFLFGILYLFARKRRVQSDYIKAAGIELVAGWILLLPYEYFDEITISNPVLRFIESCLTAVIRALNIFSVEGYERIVFQGNEDFSSVYSIIRVLVSILLALFACGWVISFFEGPAQRIKLLSRSKRTTYLFPEYNNKSVAIAKSIINDGNRDINIIFLEKNESGPAEKIDLEDNRLICLSMPLSKVLKLLSRNAPSIEVYLFGENEEQNLALLEESFADKEILKCGLIRFFVELDKTPWSLYDDYVLRKLGKGVKNVVVNFVRTEENYIFNMLASHSIFENAITEKDVPKGSSALKQIHILIVGMNDRNIEFLKAILHLGQMPGYYLKVTIFDNGEHLKKLQYLLPAIQFNSRYYRKGDAAYSLFYYENVDIDSPDLDERITEDCKDYTFAYVNVNDDLKNTALGIRLGELRRRTDAGDNFKILVNLSKLESGKWKADRISNISFSGAFNVIYSRSFITMSGIENASVEIHKLRQEERRAANETKGTNYEIQSWDEYCNSEYNRHSVYARTLAFLYKMRLIKEFYSGDYSLTTTVDWMISEHMRWDMYTRTLGYRDVDEESKKILDKMLSGAVPSDIRKITKEFRSKTGVHEDLVPYDQLSKEVQDTDALTLTPNIISILEKVSG